MATISLETLQSASLAFQDVNTLRNNSEACQPAYISHPIGYGEFFRRYLLPNRPCIFAPHITAEWRSVREWVTEDGRPNFDILDDRFGSADVPVADCNHSEYSSQVKSSLRLRDYLHYWKDLDKKTTSSSRCLYLKDWHFAKQFPDYEAYRTPAFFTSDWLNEYWDSQMSDDYRFVYMGPKGSWTPFHADVLRSFSWSANICGRKRWLLYRPGQEVNLRDSLGNLAYDVTSPELGNADRFPRYHLASKPIEITQEAGEIIFVPSGWHHQVFNLEDTISINHNWLNGCNIDLTWKFLQQELNDVKRSISDCRDMDGWESQCQKIMKANSGMDYAEFLRLLWTITSPRLQKLERWKRQSESEALFEPLNETDGPNTSGSTVVDARDSLQAAVLSQSRQELGTSDENTQHPGTSKTKSNSRQDDSGAVPQSEGCRINETEEERLLKPSLGDVWHCVFDVHRIRVILKSLLNNEDFCQIDKTLLCKVPREILNEIDCATRGIV